MSTYDFKNAVTYNPNEKTYMCPEDLSLVCKYELVCGVSDFSRSIRAGYEEHGCLTIKQKTILEENMAMKMKIPTLLEMAKENEFSNSLKTQYINRGFLTKKQYDSLEKMIIKQNESEDEIQKIKESDNDFIQSLKAQYEAKNYLTTKQLSALIKFNSSRK